MVRTVRGSFDSDAYYLTRDLATIRYLTGFSGSNATLLMSQDAATLITDGRYRDQAQVETTDVAIVIERDAMTAVIALRPSRVLVDPSLPVGDVRRIEMHGVDVELAGPAFHRLREVKDDEELQALSRACSITTRSLMALIECIAVGQTELQVARQLEALFAENGADDRAFATIVAAGPNAAVPHHRPGSRPLQSGDLLIIDSGALVDGYHADMTRTFVVAADPEPWQQQIFDVVRVAQEAGITAAVPGASACDIDAAARSVIQEAGFGEAFTHGTGHGVGLQIHEPPMLLASSVDSISAGSPITIEPGIYLPGRGGVRIEDTIVVQDTAHVLTTAPRDLTVVG